MLAAAATPAARASVLVSYSFDDRQIETGPDTFAVFERARGDVGLATAYRMSGFHSVEIRDAAGDGDFPELQGYFALRREGKLYVHFAFLVADPREELNVALAGPGGFRLGPDGIAFWLTTRGGTLAHVSNSITKKLLPLRSFTWYRVDLGYDVARGSYDLSIAEEQRLDQLVYLQDQPAAAGQRGSAVDKFSFIGDIRDESEVRYFVDDVVIETDARLAQHPFVAPGRRRLFFDVFAEARAAMRERIACLPVLGLDDLGLAPEAARAFIARHGARLAELLGDEPAPEEEPLLGPGIAPEEGRALLALSQWVLGCRALEGGAADDALSRFERAAGEVPASRLYAVSAALALAAAGRLEEAESRWRQIESDWRHDPRTPAVMAVLGRARGDWAEAEAWLRAPAEEAVADPDPPTPARSYLAEQYFFALLWMDRLRDAERYAVAVAAALERAGEPSGAWLEHAGDAAFHEGDFEVAIRRYESALALSPGRASLLLKLSDLCFAGGDAERERLYREKVFGTLR